MPHYCWVRRILSVLSLAALIFGAFGASITGEAASAAGTTYYASSTPTSITCSISYPCSLQLAADKAADGDTIIAKTGTYYDTGAQVLYIDEDVTVQGGWNGGFGRGYEIDPVKYPTVLNGENARRVVLIDGDASPTINGITIRNGIALADRGGGGGGILIDNLTGGNVVIENCYITHSSADYYGGGIYLQKGVLTIRDSFLGFNTAVYGGGGILASNGTAVFLERNIVSGNIADYGSVGHFDRASLTGKANRILANDGNPTLSFNDPSDKTLNLENNIMLGNVGTTVSVIGQNGARIMFLHNTLSENGGKGLELPDETAGLIANNIFLSSSQDSIQLGGGNTVTITHNLFWQNGTNSNKGTNYVEADPKINTEGWLLPGSSAINAGTSSSVSGDIDGQFRPLGLPDIGADEFMLSLYLPTTMR